MDFITLLKYLLLGFVQGVAEILPISSSGHLALFQALLNTNEGNEGTFALLLHVGSLVALIVFFHQLLLRLMVSLLLFIRGNKDLKTLEDIKLIGYLIIATIPSALAGVFLRPYLDQIFANLWFTAIGFAWTGILLWNLHKKQTSNAGYTFKNTFITGLFQLIGIFPGVSRSGMTITGGLRSGLSMEKAKEFAFLLFLPITAGSLLITALDPIAIDPSTIGYTVMATLVASLATYVSLHVLFKRLKTKHFRYFSYYLFLLSLSTMLYLLF
jgi:undecaprenyl-diphosphatase